MTWPPIVASIDPYLAIATCAAVISAGTCFSMRRRGVSLTNVIVFAYALFAALIALFVYLLFAFTKWPVVG